ncbi:DUF1508 domain-containing protein [Halonotius roseus]|uniref:DUF1508 domain-containing protein n=1 Tax=Halonotius roseus TaxID=2511997 RepID=A0A544QKV8_9EURY|nr:DUF1508 domain-containing protein [Halonotius roseus]TQQ79000.1 DUF1508 domain-containing protein [Halonotius roseus]
MVSENQPQESALIRWYADRIGKPTSIDEAYGYWVFALGLLLGIVGVLLMLISAPASAGREVSILAGGAGLVFLIVGPIIRLPLQKKAVYLAYAGLAVCLISLAWFTVVFPDQWSVNTGSPAVMVLYAIGLIIIGIAGFLIPLITDRADIEELEAALRDTAADESDLARRIDELLGSLADAEADEDDLSRRIEALESELGDAAADEADLAQHVRQLQSMLADTEADEADLAERIDRLHESHGRFEEYEDSAGEYRWRLRHRNGNLIATAGEGYTQRHNAQKGLNSVRRNALGATVMRIESEADLPPADEAFEPVSEVESQATVELYEDAAGEYRWRLRHDNGNLIGDGSEGYSSKSNAKRAVERVRELVAPADYLRFDPTGFEVYTDNAEQWRWRLVHKNGNILADSGEGYTRRNDANRAVDRLRERVEELEFEVFEDSAGEYRWRLRASNDEIIADSGEGYNSKGAAEDGIERVQKYAPDAKRLAIGRAAFEVFEDAGGEYRWRLRHQNGNVLADSGEGYTERRRAYEGIESIKRNTPTASLDESAS